MVCASDFLPFQICLYKWSDGQNLVDEEHLDWNSQWLTDEYRAEHSRYLSLNNFIANSIWVIAAYHFFENKPAISLCFVNEGNYACPESIARVNMQSDGFIPEVFLMDMVCESEARKYYVNSAYLF